MKRTAAVILCLAMLFAFASCGAAGQTQTDTVKTPSTSDGGTASSHPDYVPIFDFIQDISYKSFYEDIKTDTPVKAVMVADKAAGEEYEFTDADVICAMVDQLAKYSIGPKTEESVTDGNARSVTFIMEDGSEYDFSFYYKFFCYKNDYYCMDSNGSTLWTIDNYLAASSGDGYEFDPDELQYAYNTIVDDILEEMKCNISEDNLAYWISMSRGSISDLFNRGTNQMTLVYTPDGETLKAGIFALSKDYKMLSKTIEVAQLAGAAGCEIIPGDYKGNEAIFILYQNTEGDKPVGVLNGYDISGDEIECIFSSPFEGEDGLKKISEEGDVYLGATACSFGENGIGKVINTLQAT